MSTARRFPSTIGRGRESGGMGHELPRAPLAGWLAFALSACVGSSSSIGDPIGQMDGSTTNADESSTSATGTDPTTTDASSGGDSSSGGEVLTCAEWSTCTVPVVCVPGDESCDGALESNLDAGGCPRQPCEQPGDCPAGYACYRPSDWGRCGPHRCQEFDPGVCSCGIGLDCNLDAVCVPEELAPPEGTTGVELCAGFTDADACNTGFSYSDGYCRWHEGWQVGLEASCAESTPIGRCTFVRSSEVFDGSSCPGAPTTRTLATPDGDTLIVLIADAAEIVADYSDCVVFGADALCTCGCP